MSRGVDVSGRAVNVAGRSQTIGASNVGGEVVHRYKVSNFGTSTWPDEVSPKSDISVSGLTSDTFANGESAVLGDGEDHGISDSTPYDIFDGDFGVAFTVQLSNADTFKRFLGGKGSGSSEIAVWTGGSTAGAPGLFLNDKNDNQLQLETSTAYDNGLPHLVIINKPSDTVSDIDIFVDDMSASKSIKVRVDRGYDSTLFTPPDSDFGFFCQNDGGFFRNKPNAKIGFIELKTTPYTETERNDIKSRRPEV